MVHMYWPNDNINSKDYANKNVESEVKYLLTNKLISKLCTDIVDNFVRDACYNQDS